MSIADFLLCFDQACTDLAKHDLNLSEPEYRKIINNEQGFLETKPEMLAVYKDLIDQIEACLDYGDELAARKEEEEEQAKREAKA